MRVVSLFSGCGSFDHGFAQAGWETVHLCEFDQNAQKVLARNFPGVPISSDVRQLRGYDLPAAECVMFGSPCQDISVAGRRSGMTEGSDTRSSLFFEAVRIVKEMREHSGNAFPQFVLWENVCGAFSSNGGRDFAAVLRSLLELGATDVCWRTMDSQFFGVPQRRRRVFLVADFGGERAHEILFEPKSVRRNPDAGGASGQDAATRTAARAECGGGIAKTLLASRGGAGADAETETLIPMLACGPVVSTANALAGAPIAFDTYQITSAVNQSRAEPGLPVGTLTVKSSVHIAFETKGTRVAAGAVSPTLRASGGGHAGVTVTGEPDAGYMVRRLTPVECERLQSMPDGWTDVNGMADSHRYRMLGNAGTATVLSFIAERMKNSLTLEAPL